MVSKPVALSSPTRIREYVLITAPTLMGVILVLHEHYGSPERGCSRATYILNLPRRVYLEREFWVYLERNLGLHGARALGLENSGSLGMF